MCTCASHCPESPHHERACCSATRCDCACHKQTSAPGYPADWPRCPSCGDFALDGHITCGRLECQEASYR